MPRSLNDIQQSILDDKDSNAELSALEVLTTNEKTSLSNLTSTSKAAVWRLFVYIIALAIYTLEQILDVFRTEIEIKVKANRPHTADWYKTKALAFQYGDTLVDSDEYTVIDETKKVIKQVACIEGDRKITIKIATLNGDNLVKVSDNNIVNAFMAYMHKVKDAGTLLEYVNEDADLLRVEYEFYYDPLLIKSDGTTIDTNINVVNKAIDGYLKSLDFNGEFDINKMTDYIQSATGYVSLKLNYVGFKAALATSYTQITRNYKPLSGYMKIADLVSINYAVI